MFPREPTTTAIFLLVFGGLLAASVILSRTLGRAGVPVVLVFLVLGMVAGSDALGIVYFDDHRAAFQLGTVALAFILFDGGLNTRMEAIRANAAPAVVLATVGVAATALLVAVCARALGFGWTEALLLGAVVSSTDAAAVFSVLRGTGLHLPRRIGATLELESGINDPMAVILTLTLTQSALQPGSIGPGFAITIVVQLVVGAVLGVAIGYAGRFLLRRVQPFAGGLYPVLTVSIAAIAFGVPTLLMGSGFLAVYVAGAVVGGGRLPYRTGLLRVHDFLAWLAQVVMFVTLGLLVFPSELPTIAVTGLAIAGFLALVARPVVVAVCLAPFRYGRRAVAYIGWVGLRGAVPIILAAFPVFAGVEGGRHIFNVVFFVVVVSALIQGGTLQWVTRWLGLNEQMLPQPSALLEISSTQELQGEVLSFYIEPASAVCGSTLAEIPFPDEAAAMLVIRGDVLLPAKGGTRLLPGDHVYVFCRPDDRPFLQLLFVREEKRG